MIRTVAAIWSALEYCNDLAIVMNCITMYAVWHINVQVIEIAFLLSLKGISKKIAAILILNLNIIDSYILHDISHELGYKSSLCNSCKQTTSFVYSLILANAKVIVKNSTYASLYFFFFFIRNEICNKYILFYLKTKITLKQILIKFKYKKLHYKINKIVIIIYF